LRRKDLMEVKEVKEVKEEKRAAEGGASQERQAD
jgi:hypothetical protein